METELLKKVFKDVMLFKSPETGASFGRLLSVLHKEQLLVEKIRELGANGHSEICNRWLHAYQTKEHLPDVPQLVQADLKSIEHTIFAVKWLVDSGTMFDSENTLIHAILSSNENVNVLIIDDGQAIAKRDVGLYALEYGNAYVASICPLYSYSKAVQALKEAADFQGPSIIILFAPDSKQNENTDQLQRVKLAKDAIEDGTISLYRWNSVKLEVDSNKPKIALENFLKKQADLSLILEEKDVDDQRLVNHMDHLVLEAAKKSYKQLHGALNKTKLLILYGSDGGNGQSLAKRIGFEAREKGLLPKVMPMDDFNGDDLPLEEHILFIVSTAGQGEFPANARELSRYLAKATVNLSSLSYSVFALGDSHYWPRSEDAHFFCKAGKDLDGFLQKLGAKQLSAIGLGDDRDPDGYSTAFNKWVPEFWQSLGVDSSVVDNGANAPSDDAIKAASNYLRGTIAKGLLDESTGSLFEYDTKLTKFHGIYQQDDRDLREYRARKGMEKAYSFMIRVRVPGGVSTPRQYLAMDEIADKYANSTIKITTRQAFQFHGVFKSVLKRTIQDINKSLLDTIAACGDVNRNVMCNPNPGDSSVHQIVLEFSKKLSAHLTPSTSAYHEIWLDKKLVAGGDYEPLYGKTYLPRKFKIAVAVPPHNDVDVLAHCLGYIAIVENGVFKGFNVTVGGGMGQTHGNSKTYPRLAEALGFVETIEDAISVGEKVMLVQRDYGDRVNRKHARLKYTIADRGIEWFRKEVETRIGYNLQPSRPYQFTSNGDRYGWQKSDEGLWSFTLFIQNGRIRDTPEYMLKSGLREIAKIHLGEFALTPNQHLIISKIKDSEKAKIEGLLSEYGINNEGLSGLRLNSMACVALPTCALAMAESERYLPSLIDKIEFLLERYSLQNEPITIRMTGCPNGCARPSIAEIAFIGKAPDTYNMYLGGGFNGERLNKVYKESVNEQQILEFLDELLKSYALNRLDGEHFGDFTIRQGIIA